ncbi:ATP-dependent DNA helicase tlh1 [Colletotrichum higginsianum]|uniref:ATP-dependent DNA helicase tlh1 n=1 Tax=Colletotrichum higginsianum TaxID=80884 RepID=A0A4T0VCU5_9PEZI|nr:ATP-dependent DNA helicase tlh1 [Colletotrichum higginsianum]
MGFIKHLDGWISREDVLRRFSPDAIHAVTPYTVALRTLVSSTLQHLQQQVGQPILCALNRRAWSEDSPAPFNYILEQATLSDYTATWRRRPSGPQPPSKRIAVAIYSLLDHKLYHDPFESPLLAATAFMAVRTPNAYHTQSEYGKSLSAIVKISLLAIYTNADFDRQAARAAAANAMPADPPAPKLNLADHLIELMKRTAYAAAPRPYTTPLAWTFDRQTALSRLRLKGSTATEDVVQWTTDPNTDDIVLNFRNIRMPRSDMRAYSRALLDTAEHYLLRVLFVGQVSSLEEAVASSKLPLLPKLDQVLDDVSELKTGYSFLNYEMNQEWASIGVTFLESQVTSGATPYGTFTRDNEPNIATIQKYQRDVNAFLSVLLTAIHVTYGQPARAPEIVSLRVENTPYGGLRNVFMRKGHVAIHTIYHKGLRIKKEYRPIYRFLPIELSYIMVYYRWLVRPFMNGLGLLAAEAAGKQPVGVSAYLLPADFVLVTKPVPSTIRDYRQEAVDHAKHIEEMLKDPTLN